ncbi:MAG TPA: zf-HC2 domain-containing protein, partial [Gemmataceae bacterium]|nr:zf-HC2 domain-containing protein [Gemmataceae bacterium]
MKPCEQYQAMMLDYLYGLLDTPEVDNLSVHLKDCAGCQAALAQSESHKQMLAQAAKLEFPEVRFDPTVLPLISAKKRPAVVSPSRGERAWARWALAALVLLAVGGLSFSNNLYWQQQDRLVQAKAHAEDLHHQIHNLSAEQFAKRDRVEKGIIKLHQDLDSLQAKLVQEETMVKQTNMNKQLHLTISGPPTVEAGALNEYLVKVRNRQNRPVPVQFTAKILDQTKKELAAIVEVQPQGVGDYRLALPRNLSVKPNSDLFLTLSAKSDNEKLGEITEKLNLVAPIYLTHLMTDKPMYQPGEVVHFRSLTLERFSLKPAPEELRLNYTLTKPTQEKEELLLATSRVSREEGQISTPLLGPDKEPIRGIGAGDLYLDPAIPGGEYTITVSEANHRFPPQDRKFIVNQYAKPRLNKELEFTRKSYGPGDEVAAACKVAAVEGGMNPAGLNVIATLRVDGREIAAQSLRTDANGAVRVKFQLPGQMEKGDGSLAMLFQDNANTETLVRPIPI